MPLIRVTWADGVNEQIDVPKVGPTLAVRRTRSSEQSIVLRLGVGQNYYEDTSLVLQDGTIRLRGKGDPDARH